MENLIKARLISFFWSIVTLIGTTVAAVLVSPAFQAIVAEHFGSGALGTLILLLVTEAVKHERNLHVLKVSARRFGEAGANRYVTLI